MAQRLIVIGLVVLALVFGWKLLCWLWAALCAIVSGIWSGICGLFGWIGHAILSVLAWILEPERFVAEDILGGGDLDFCAGLAVEAILIGIVIAIIAAIVKRSYEYLLEIWSGYVLDIGICGKSCRYSFCEKSGRQVC